MSKLTRQMGLLGLAATGICSMLGAAINVVPFMLHRSVPGIGPYVLPAYLFAAVPAILAALAYAMLASAMPRAGGSYVYASRALSPYLGFVASFSQWFGLSIAMGVVSYLIVPFLRDVASAVGWEAVAASLEIGPVRVTLALAFMWIFALVNLRGVRLYERILVPLMFLMFALGSVVIVAGFLFDTSDFAAAVAAQEGGTIPTVTIPNGPAPGDGVPPFRWSSFLAAAAILFSSFIGFDSIAQAGGEARDPRRNLPLAIGIAIITVGSFYLLFTAAIYHAVPWTYIAEQAQIRDLTAPGLLGYLLPSGWTVAIVAGAAVALLNDLPAMLMAVSRLMFAWGEDGIFPRRVATIDPRYKTPRVAIVASACMASVGILGSHFAGDFFLGIDILVTSMLVNFLLMCLSVLILPRTNAHLAAQIAVGGSRGVQVLVGGLGTVLLSVFLVVHIGKDLTATVDAWYFHSTAVWLCVMALATAIYVRERGKLVRAGVDFAAKFRTLPEE